ncbi:NAD(P)H-binding protein [Streptosporangium sp. KLBMP 9127]|nr:NAD(P)H-binding protein [Streptosporangium sp. KLBMP 9127]
MTILVTGGRGAVAKSLLALLDRAGQTVRVGSRRPEEVRGAVRCDLGDPDTFPEALRGVESVFLYAEASTVEAFAEQAAVAGVEHVVLLSSSMAADPADPHHVVERALHPHPFEVTVLRPGTFAGNARQWSWPIRTASAVSLPYPNAYTDPLHEADLAEVAYEVLRDPGLHGGIYTVTGPESLTFAEQIGRIADVTGKPIAVHEVSRAAWKAEMADHLPGAFADKLLDWWHSADGVPAVLTDTVKRVTGHPARPFATWAGDNVADFTA